MSVAESAIGAILEIPDDLLTKIKSAEGHIKSLGETSERVAKEVSAHWGAIATSGLDAFIRKLQEATGVMSAVSGKPIDININTQPLENKLNDVSNASKKTADDVSKTVQTLAWDTLDFTNMERLRESLMGLNTSYEQLEATIKSMQNTRSKLHPDDTMGLSQEITNKIELLKEYIALRKKSEEQLKSKVTDADKNILDEQKRLLAEQLDLRRQINAQKKIVASGEITGSAKLNEERAILQQLYEQYRKNSAELRAIKKEKGDMSDTGRDKFDLANERQKNTLLELQIKYRQDLNKELTRAAELTAQTQVGKARLGNTEEAAVQRQLNSDYKQMLGVIKEIGEVKAKAAEQGRGLNQQEINLIATLGQRYRMYHDDIQRVSGAYSKMSEAAAKNFQADKSEQFARNAVMLADAQQKAAGNTNHLVAEYKKLYAENEKLYASMKKYYNEAGGTPSTAATGTRQVDAAYREIEARHAEVLRQMRDLESKNIQEIADFRMQKNMEANQRSISEFIQAEAQKTAEAKRQAEQQSNDRIQAYQRFLNTYQGAMAAANKLGTRGGQWEDTYENRARVIKNLEAAIKNLNKADADYERKLKELTDALNKLKSAQKEVTDAMKPSKPMVSPQDAINAAKNATSLKQLQDAYKQLKEVMATADPKSQAWSQMNSQLQKTKTSIDEIKKKMGEFQSQASKTSGLMGQLQGRIAAAFSIGAISGFIKKMVEVRAQFELQRVALGAIIQDRDEANKIFTQVQNMALESPFNIMQLEKATKQIAAFGFETKKLVPTMKMFADISAGLGVEIDRLVLVMGHLKARNFLEGTMVRQFTNMGFNVLGELSKYYSELENKMVSVGEVQDRVKKKMVSFEDVEEVLKRVTSAGGMFYDMQKKQSESLWGQLQRIKDAYDLMLNDIGQSNEGTLKSALAFIRTLINHWRALAPIIQATGAAIVVYFAVSRFSAIAAGIGGVVRAFKNMTTVIWGAKAAQDALNASQKANAWGLLASLIIGATVAIIEYTTAQSKLEESLERVRSEGVNNMYDLIFQYRRLADTVRDTNATYDERNKALEEIKRIYKDILPDQMLEIDNIKQMKSGYDEATQAIQAYYAEKIRAQQKETIDENFGKDMTSEITDISDSMADVLAKNKNLVGDASKTAIKAAVRNVLNIVTDEIKSGQTEADKLHERFLELLASTLGVSAGDLSKLTAELKNTQGQVIGFTKINLANYLLPLDNIFKKIEEKYGEISTVGLAGITLASEQERKAAQDEVDRYSALEKAVDAYKKALQNLREEMENGNIKGDIMWSEEDGFYAEATNKLGQSALDTFTKAWSDLWDNMGSFDKKFIVTMDDINTAMQSQIDMSVYFEKVNEQTFGSVLANWKNWGKELTDNNYFANFIEKMMDKRRELDLSVEQKQIRALIKEVGDLNNVDLSKYKWALIDSKDNVASVAKEAKAEVETLKSSIEKYQAAVAAGLPAIIAQAWFLGSKTLEEMQQTLKAVEMFSHRMGNADKSSKGGKGKDPILELWKNRKKAIEDYYTAREKARKNLSTDEAEAQLNRSFETLWKELKLDKVNGLSLNDLLMQGFDPKTLQGDLVSSLETLKKLIPAKYKDILKEVESAISKERVEIEFKVKEGERERLQRSITDMFDSYALTKELSNLGVSVDLTYMVGGKPTTLADIRREYERLMEGFADKSEEEQKIIKKMGEDLTKKEFDVRKQQLTNYNKFLLESMSERIQIELKAHREISRISNDETLDETTRLMAIRRENEKLKKDLASQQWKDFQGSDLYIQLFENIEQASTQSIKYVLQKLKSLRASLTDLPPDQLKAVMKQIDKLETQLNTRNPFAALKDNIGTAIKAFKELGAAERAFQDANERYEIERKTRDDYAAWTTELEQQLAIERAKLGVDEFGQQIENDITRELAKQIKLRREQLGLMNENVDTLESEKNRLADVVADFKKGKEAAGQALQQIGAWAQEAASTIGDIANSLENVFGTMSDGTRDAVESIQEILGGVGDMASGVGRFLAGDVIGGSLQAVKGLASTIGSIFAINDKKKERDIQKLIDKVDTLDKAYQKLEKSIEAAYRFDDYKAGYSQMQKTLDAEKSAYEEMIALEKAKKKTDKDKVKQYEDAIEEIAEKQKELQNSMIEDFGSTTDYRSAAEDFVSAWLDAYKETGDGLDALNDNWQEFIQNLFIKQAALAKAGDVYKDVIDIINNAMTKGKTDFSLKEAIAEAQEAANKGNEYMNDYLKALAEAFNIRPDASGELILSDLQKGIQNITEPQAAAIEAYLNSMRFAVFRHTEQLDTLIATIQMQYGSGAENPVVTELKGIRGVLDNIYRDLHSVVKNGVGKTYIQVG